MTLFRWLTAFFFGCFHNRTTFPITVNRRTYVACLSCGEEFPYNWQTMKRGDTTEYDRLERRVYERQVTR